MGNCRETVLPNVTRATQFVTNFCQTTSAENQNLKTKGAILSLLSTSLRDSRHDSVSGLPIGSHFELQSRRRNGTHGCSSHAEPSGAANCVQGSLQSMPPPQSHNSTPAARIAMAPATFKSRSLPVSAAFYLRQVCPPSPPPLDILVSILHTVLPTSDANHSPQIFLYAHTAFNTFVHPPGQGKHTR